MSGNSTICFWTDIYDDITILKLTDDLPRDIRVLANNHSDPRCPGPGL
jgi:hypothetical protein